MIGWPMPGGIRRHIAQHPVSRAADGRLNRCQHRRIGHVSGKNIRPDNPLGFQQINTDKTRRATA